MSMVMPRAQVLADLAHYLGQAAQTQQTLRLPPELASEIAAALRETTEHWRDLEKQRVAYAQLVEQWAEYSQKLRQKIEQYEQRLKPTLYDAATFEEAANNPKVAFHPALYKAGGGQ